MAGPEAFENWVSIGGVIGSITLGWAGVWVHRYRTARLKERKQSEASPEVAAQSVGAAFVDRSTAQDIASIAHDVGSMHKIMLHRQEHDDKKELEEIVRRATEDNIRVLKEKGELR